MKGKILAGLAAAALAVFSSDINAREFSLNAEEELRLNSYIHGIYVLNTLTGPHPPYLCIYSVFYDAYYYPVSEGMKALLEPLSRKDRKYVTDNLFDTALWWVTLDELGCGDYDPTKIYDLIP